MRFLNYLFCLGISVSPSSSQTAIVSVRADVECNLTVDGNPQGTLKPGIDSALDLPPGEHKFEATSLAGGATWKQTRELTSSVNPAVLIPLRAEIERLQAQSRGYWTDASTGFTWASADNGSAVSRNQADHYCRALILGGHNDWRLPHIDELQQVFGGPANDHGYRIAGPIKLTGWAWSSTEGKEPAEGWALDFGDGARASVVTGDAGLNRALCVRSDKIK